MPQQSYHHPFLLNAKVDRIWKRLGEDAAEFFINFAVGFSQFCDGVQLGIERSDKSVAKFLSSPLIIPGSGFIKVVPDFWKHMQQLHPRLAFTSARNCSRVSALEGSRSNRAQRESSSFFSASLISGSSFDSPIDCHKTSTSISFSHTGSAWSLRRSAAVMEPVSNSVAQIQGRFLSHAQRGSVRLQGDHMSRERFGVLQPSGAFRGPDDTRKHRRAGALQDAVACFHLRHSLMS